MIDLSYTRARLLAEIEATDSAGEPLSNITDPRVATRDVRVRVCGRGRHDLFPLLKAALLERFAAAPRLQLIRDLLIPLRNALGNAFKHGNGRDPTKTISVELVLARKGALIAVSDEGAGFDVAVTFRRFQGDESYFVNQGCGFRNLHQAMSSVSYENGGRTVLLCFRPMESLEPAAGLPVPEPVVAGVSPAVEPGVPPGGKHVEASKRAETTDLIPGGKMPPSTAGETPAATFRGASRAKNSAGSLPKLLDGEWIQACLSAELPEFANGQTRIESCRVYATRGCAGDGCGNRFALRVVGHDGRLAETRVLTGRFHTTTTAAEADFEAATKLNDARILNRLRIPRPVGRLAGEPRLVLYDFDPWMNLWEYFTYRGRLKTLCRTAKRIARALAHLHRSQVVFPEAEPERVGDGLQAMALQAEKHLQTLPCGPDLVNRFRVAAQRIQSRAAFGRQRIAAPIHGSLGWDCIHYGVDGRFYLYRFEMCRCSDPGLDLGGFAADLLCFTLASHDEEAYRVCLDDFLGKYNSEAAHPISQDDLLPYTALALIGRLGLADDSSTNAGPGRLLAALEAALTSGPRGGESELRA